MATPVKQHVVINRSEFQRVQGLCELFQRVGSEVIAAKQFLLLVQIEDDQAQGTGGDAVEHGGQRAQQHHLVARPHFGATRRQRRGVQKHGKADRTRIILIAPDAA